MHFHEKLDLLMVLTKTSNILLAKHVSLDASYISRLKSGTRKLPKDQVYTRHMSDFFANRCLSNEHYRKIVCDAVGYDLISDSQEEISDFIHNWMLDHKEEDEESDIFFSEFPEVEFRKHDITYDDIAFSTDYNNNDALIFFGHEGRQRAIFKFLKDITTSKRQVTILLYSDDKINWFTEDEEHTELWQKMLLEILRKGNKIKIIENSSRDFNERINNFNFWLPLMLTGNVSSYYCPFIRDEIIKNTFFIAPGTNVIISSVVQKNVSHEPILVLKDKEIISAYEKNFYDFLELCKPLFWVIKPQSMKSVFRVIYEFEKSVTPSTVKSFYFTINTMPDDLYNEMLENQLKGKVFLRDFYASWKNSFLDKIETSVYNEVIYLPSAQEIINGKIEYAFSKLFNDTTYYYTPKDAIRHLEEMIKLLEKYENYRIYLSNDEKMLRNFVYYKENYGIIFFDHNITPVFNILEEKTMLSVCHYVLGEYTNQYQYSETVRQITLSKLQNLVNDLKSYINRVGGR